MTDTHVRNTQPEDFAAIEALSRKVYPGVAPWTPRQLAAHLETFPEGQLVAVLDGQVVGMAASLVVSWDDYEPSDSWRDFTSGGWFTNHDPAGRTLYGAEVMVDADARGQGVGSALYVARRELVQRLGLLRIRAGARLPGYHRYADRMSAEAYAARVVQGALHDATLSFQVHQGFRVLQVVPGYLRGDRESLGYAALIEWLNPELARPEDHEAALRWLARQCLRDPCEAPPAEPRPHGG